jgi:hypothetical protein
VELEEEDGLLIYSFDIRLADRSILEIHVDAMTGNVVGQETESQADEDAEVEEHEEGDEHEGAEPAEGERRG